MCDVRPDRGRVDQCTVSEFTDPHDRERTQIAFDFAVKDVRSGRVEKRYLHKSGRTVWAVVSYAVVEDDDGRPSHTISQIEDVSARRESEQALLEAYEADRAATERLAQLERMRAEMASTVSHELRTPLTSVAGYVELLSEGDAGALNVDQQRMLGVVDSQPGPAERHRQRCAEHRRYRPLTRCAVDRNGGRRAGGSRRSGVGRDAGRAARAGPDHHE